jgi:2-methylcitrate dehydratase
VRGGATTSAETRYFKGHVRNPLTDAEIEAKFRMLAAHALAPGQMDKVLATVWRLEKLKDIGELLGLLKFRSARRKK